MRIKLNFNGTIELFNGSTQHLVNGFIHSVLGSNNKYHDSFSNYAVSSLQGGKLVEGGISYENGAYIFVSSNDLEFNDNIMIGLMTTTSTIGSLTLNNIEIVDFKPHFYYDVVRTISPILLKDNDSIITFKDSSFIDVLLKKTKKKLLSLGLKEKDVNTLDIQPFHFENAKLKYVKVKNVVNLSSQVMLIIKGDIEVRRKLYEMGLGKSTGCGFGSVEIIETNI